MERDGIDEIQSAKQTKHNLSFASETVLCVSGRVPLQTHLPLKEAVVPFCAKMTQIFRKTHGQPNDVKKYVVTGDGSKTLKRGGKWNTLHFRKAS